MTKHTGIIRYFDPLTQSGIVRLSINPDVQFKVYSCNMIGADSHYPHLVTTIPTLKSGDVIEFELSDDEYLNLSCGIQNGKLLKTSDQWLSENMFRARV